MYKVASGCQKNIKHHSSSKSSSHQLLVKQVSSSFYTRAGSKDSLRTDNQSSPQPQYVPPRRLQDKSKLQLQLIQVPLSRAQLNNQSAYHLAETSQRDTAKSQLENQQECMQQRSRSDLKQRLVLHTSATVIESSSKVQQPDLTGDPGATGSTISQVFGRSQSNHQIGMKKRPLSSKRQSNSQSRGKLHEPATTGKNAMHKQTNSGTSFDMNSGKKATALTVMLAASKHSSSQQTKVLLKSHNNLKMSTMQLRDQDFKKITSQIQCQTMMNVKKKKIQLGSGVSKAQIMTGVPSTTQNKQSSHKTQHESTTVTSKIKKGSKIGSPHRRSIQQVCGTGAQLYPVDGGAEMMHIEESIIIGSVSNRRKFANSLTDKYQGDGNLLEDFTSKQPDVPANNNIQSSDDGASNLIPSESDRIEASQAITIAQNKSKKVKVSKRINQGIQSSQSNLQSQQKYSVPTGGASAASFNVFFPDPKSSLFERKKSSVERQSNLNSVLPSGSYSVKNTVGKRRVSSSKHIEPHRLVKVTKPLHTNSLLSKNMQQIQSHKVSPLNSMKKSNHHAQLSSKNGSNLKLQQPQPSGLLSTSSHATLLQKKSGSFGGGYREPKNAILPTTTHQQINNVSNQQQCSHGQTVTTPLSDNSISNQPYLPDSGCQSPDQPLRKREQMHLNLNGPGSLIATANLIRQSPQGSFINDSVGLTVKDQTQNLKQPINSGRAADFRSVKITSPTKKITKKLSHKLGEFQYNTTTATKKILQHSAEPSSYVSKGSTDEMVTTNGRKLTKHGHGEAPVGVQMLQIKLQQTNDRPNKQNIQLLRQVHHKQITTASKGKESGVASFKKLLPGSLMTGSSGTKSYSVLVASKESVAQSKALFQTAKQQQSGGPTPQSCTSLANSAEKTRRPLGGSLIVEGVISEHRPMETTPAAYSESQKSSCQNRLGQMQPLLMKQERKKDFMQEIESESEVFTAGDLSSKPTSFISQKYTASQNQNPLNVIMERLESLESTVSDPNMSPRSRQISKLQKIVKFAFLKTGGPPETQTQNYKIGKVMGKGAFGKVNLAIHRLASKFVALKSINKQFLTQEQSKRKVMQEFNILRRTRHGNIVRLYESFETQQHIVFVMEVCGGGDLLTYVRRRRKLKEETARFLFRQVIKGLACCHTKNVLHRDIKLDNILLTSQGDVKICDFGVSQVVTPDEKMTEQCGTPAYIAPEVFKNEGYKNFASDIWSAGVVLYAMLFGAVPFKANNMADLHRQVIEKQPSYKEEEISSEALDLLRGILEKDPDRRLTSEMILTHSWMQQGNYDANYANVFSDQEKDGIIAEFEYYNKRERDVIGTDGEHQVVPTDPFAEQMLSSTQNSEIKNASTHSNILAPFNSTRSQFDYREETKAINQMMAPRGALKFSAKCKEIDRQYEQNNNADLDNGVYHLDGDEDEDAAKEEQKDIKFSKINSTPIAGNNASQPTEERPDTRLRSRAHDEASIADSFNQEHLQSQLNELDEANNSIDSADLDENGRLPTETNYVTPATSAKRMTTEQYRQMLEDPAQNSAGKGPPPTIIDGRKILSEWRQLEKQMISDRGSPPKQSLLGLRLNDEEIKGLKIFPDSGDLVQDLEVQEVDQSYEQVCVELFDDNDDNKNKLMATMGTGLVAPQILTNNKQQKQQSLVICEASVGAIERSGYPRPYIMTSLNNDDLNHVTTFYYLLQTENEY